MLHLALGKQYGVHGWVTFLLFLSVEQKNIGGTLLSSASSPTSGPAPRLSCLASPRGLACRLAAGLSSLALLALFQMLLYVNEIVQGVQVFFHLVTMFTQHRFV